jgi:hypothetical protein
LGWFQECQLLQKASSSFDVLLTADQRLRYQQNISKFAIGVVAIETVDTTLANQRRLLPEMRQAIRNSAPGTITVIVFP